MTIEKQDITIKKQDGHRTINDIEEIAIEHGWIVNPNGKVVSKLLERENQLYDEFGEFYCPCKIKRIPENVCPCKDAQKEIDETGHCHCNLYHKKEKYSEYV